MNKKLIYLFVVLVAGLFLIGACSQEAVGRKVMNKNIVGDEDKKVDNSQDVYGNYMKQLIHYCKCKGGNNHFKCPGTCDGCCGDSGVETDIILPDQ